MKRYGVVMAGGGGTRFWPLSRRKKPKQLLNLTGKELLINEAIDRLKPLSENGEVFVVTGADQAKQLKELTGDRLKDSNLLREPAARNTAPCIGLACIEILERFGDSILIVVPADPAIRDEKRFRETLALAAKAAEEKDGIITIGIKPTFACTGYGYIRKDAGSSAQAPGSGAEEAGETEKSAEPVSGETAAEEEPAEPEGSAAAVGAVDAAKAAGPVSGETAAEEEPAGPEGSAAAVGAADAAKATEPVSGETAAAEKVIEFTEKPDQETAEKYVSSGNYFWNSGMFVFRASVMLNLFAELLPDIYEKLEQIRPTVRTQAKAAVLQKIYPQIPKISIDYGIMERAAAKGRVYVLPGDFGWSDVGSFPEMAALHQADERGNVSFGDVLEEDAENCVIISSDRLVAALGVKDLIIAETEDAVLVCPKDRAQEIGKLTEKLKELEREELI